MTAGIFIDGWAHINLTSLEIFFTPWHAVFYSGFLTTAGWVVYQALRFQPRPRAFAPDAVPAGYLVGVFGVLLFGLGGVADMLWAHGLRYRGGHRCAAEPLPHRALYGRGRSGTRTARPDGDPRHPAADRTAALPAPVRLRHSDFHDGGVRAHRHARVPTRRTVVRSAHRRPSLGRSPEEAEAGTRTARGPLCRRSASRLCCGPPISGCWRWASGSAGRPSCGPGRSC